MWDYVGLTSAFILLASVLLWLLISSKTNVVVKTILIAFVMWYGLVVYYTPKNIMGWPTEVSSVEKLPEGSWVINILVKEPNKRTGAPGAIFFTVVETGNRSDKKITLNPKEAFTYKGRSDPRIYKIPYTKDLHKKVAKAKKDQAKKKGSSIRIRKGGKIKGKSGSDDRSKGLFEIVNPQTLLQK